MTTPSFASDNAAGIHPAIMEAIAAANRGHAIAYGHDEHTAAAIGALRDAFGEAAHPLLVLTGTGANVLALRALVDSYQSVICAATSHLWLDECAAPERFLGCKVVPVATPDGKLTPELVRPYLTGFGFVHHAQPRAISVAQPTEWGTLYSTDELAALAELAHGHGMILHVDGARLCNAAAALEVGLGALAGEVGVDALSFGGTKAGLLAGEAVIYYDAEAAARAVYYRKQSTQLASKMRFVAAQLSALLTGELWREIAGHANQMAARLGAGLAALPGVELVRPVETNGVFARLPADRVADLQARAFFHMWDQTSSIARLMCAWDTAEADVVGFLGAAREIL
jgi:threonine aldolase